jgi:hypothetical protein
MNKVSAEFLHAFEAIKMIREKWTYQVEAEAVHKLEKVVTLYHQRALTCEEDDEASEIAGQMRMTFVQFQERYLAFLPPEKRPIVLIDDPNIPEGALIAPEGGVSDDEVDTLIAEIDELLAEDT